MTLAHGVRLPGPKSHVLNLALSAPTRLLELPGAPLAYQPGPGLSPPHCALRTRPTWLFQQNNSLFLPPHLPSGAEKLLYWLFILNLFNPP